MIRFRLSPRVQELVGSDDAQLYPGLTETAPGRFEAPSATASLLLEDLLDHGTVDGLGYYSSPAERAACRRAATALLARF